MQTQYELAKVHYDGKWVEFWFKGDDPNGRYSISAKAGKFQTLLGEADLFEHVMNNGVSGLKLEFKFVEPNWELDRVFL